MKSKKLYTFLTLHIILFVYSFSVVLSKRAAQYPFLSLPFILHYGGLLVILGLYAIAWQQILKRIPVATAYTNKALLSVWTVTWGMVFFHERLTWGKLLGILIILCGVLLFSSEKGAGTDE